MDRKFLMTAFGYGILGLLLGTTMGATQNHAQMPTHAHIMLLGFVVSFVYGAVYKLWVHGDTGTLGKAQFWLHQVGTAGLLISLYLLYGGHLGMDKLALLLAVSSIAALTAMILMKVILIRAK